MLFALVVVREGRCANDVNFLTHDFERRTVLYDGKYDRRTQVCFAYLSVFLRLSPVKYENVGAIIFENAYLPFKSSILSGESSAVY